MEKHVTDDLTRRVDFAICCAVPIYEYRCDECGAAFEKFVRHPGRETVLCPSCGCDRIAQQVSHFGFPVPGKTKEPYRGPHKEDFKPPVHDD